MFRILIVLLMLTAVVIAEDDPITKYITALPWQGSHAASPRDEDRPDFTIAVFYEKEDVVSDKDIIPLKLYLGSKRSNSRQVKYRDSFGAQQKWCNGAANVEKVSQDGFTVNLKLTWGGVNISNETFEVTFDCPWETRQVIDKTSGFQIVVETKKYTAEPSAGGDGIPPPQP